MEPLGLDFEAMLASKIEPKTDPKIEQVENQKIDSRVGGGSVFEGQGVSQIEEKSMPKRLQDKSDFEDAKNHETVSNIGPSWRSKSSQVASNSKWKMKSILNGQNKSPDEITTTCLDPTGGKPPGHLAKAKWAQKLRTRYED